jgi:hypothetical protein
MRRRSNPTLNQLQLALQRARCQQPLPEEVRNDAVQALAALLLEAYEQAQREQQNAQGDRDERKDHP